MMMPHVQGRKHQGTDAPPNNEMQLTKRTEAGRVSKIGCLHLKGASQLISVLNGPTEDASDRA
jgi:hypothetical protein